MPDYVAVIRVRSDVIDGGWQVEVPVDGEGKLAVLSAEEVDCAPVLANDVNDLVEDVPEGVLEPDAGALAEAVEALVADKFGEGF